MNSGVISELDLSVSNNLSQKVTQGNKRISELIRLCFKFPSKVIRDNLLPRGLFFVPVLTLSYNEL